MRRHEAAEKLVEMFGGMDIIGAAHTIVTQASKYIIILLFAVYTLQCFTPFFGKSDEKKEAAYGRQRKIIFIIHFTCSLALFLNSLSVRILIYYAVQLLFLFFVGKSYAFVYKGISKTALNNMLMLFAIGFIMIERLSEGYAARQMAFACAICLVGLFIPYVIEKFPYFDRFGAIYAAAGIIMLALVFVIGEERGGSRNWIAIGGFAMQPSEFVKIVFVFFAAAFFSKSTEFSNIVKATMLAAAHVLILVAEKDLGAALIFYMTYLLMLFAATGSFAYLGAGFGAGAVAAAAAYRFFAHVQTRVAAWRDPWSRIDGAGYQIANSLFAIGTGGWFGMGLFEGSPDAIPVSESDFIFSAICEELGVFFGICLILVEISCFVMFVNISLKMRGRFYKLAAFGLSVEYIFQVFINIGGAIKFIPSTGVTLPFVSYGGSSVISSVALFCIMQGMYVLSSAEKEGKNAVRRREAKLEGRPPKSPSAGGFK